MVACASHCATLVSIPVPGRLSNRRYYTLRVRVLALVLLYASGLAYLIILWYPHIMCTFHLHTRLCIVSLPTQTTPGARLWLRSISM
jgi:hypothetical protein